MKTRLRTSARSGLCALCAAGLLLFAFSCAKQAPPPGGPEDRIPPLVAGVYPAPNGLNVPMDAKIVIEFTEWMNESVNPTMLSFSPPLRKTPRLEMVGPRLTILPREPLDSGLTYTVELSAAFADLHGNKLPAPFRLGFSTGDKIDSLELFGSVSAEGALPKGTVVGLWPMEKEQRAKFAWFRERARSASDSADAGDDAVADLMREPALYRARPDSAGDWSMRGLPEGHWRLAAFVDLNGNGAVNPPEEAVALTDREVVLRPGAPAAPFALALAKTDTGMVRLESAEQLPHGYVVLAFSRAPSDESLKNLSAYRFAAADSADASAPPVVREALRQQTTGAPMLRVEGGEAEKTYVLKIEGIADSAGVGIDSAKNEAEIAWKSFPSDTARPVPSGATPANGDDGVLPEDTLSLWFDGPVALDDWAPRLRLLFAGETLEVRAEPLQSNRLRLVPPRELPLGVDGAILLSTADTSLKRNAEGGSDTVVSVRWKTLSAFRSADPMKFGSARVCVPPHPGARISLRRVDKAAKPFDAAPDGQGCAEFASLPEGKWLARSFVDLDGDGRRNPGSLRPWAPAEPLFLWPDTLETKRGERATLDLRRSPDASGKPGAENGRNDIQGVRE
ncbi:MAG: Ig-like domain-containing protein [Fibrobacterales bacterium]|nr:Ig-like domain-containing protein [Fibrobacterales bacterium]